MTAGSFCMLRSTVLPVFVKQLELALVAPVQAGVFAVSPETQCCRQTTRYSQDRQQHLHDPSTEDRAQQQTQVHVDCCGELHSKPGDEAKRHSFS
jgi:hypothetical protein